MALDNPYLGFAAKELSRKMAKPEEQDEKKIKRVIRYLVGAPRAISRYCWQQAPRQIHIYTDSDWAGCVRTRKSTSGGTMLLGSHCVQHWSRTQSSPFPAERRN